MIDRKDLGVFRDMRANGLPLHENTIGQLLLDYEALLATNAALEAERDEWQRKALSRDLDFTQVVAERDEAERLGRVLVDERDGAREQRNEALREVEALRAELARLKPAGQVAEDMEWVEAAVDNRLIQFWMDHPAYDRSTTEARIRARAALSRLAAGAQEAEALRQRVAALEEALQHRERTWAEKCREMEALERAGAALGEHVSELEKSLENARKALEETNAIANIQTDRALRAEGDLENARKERDGYKSAYWGAEHESEGRLEVLATLRRERDAAVANNAAMVGRAQDIAEDEGNVLEWRNAARAILGNGPHPGAALLERVKRLEEESAEILGALRTWAGNDMPAARNDALQALLRKVVLTCSTCGDDKPVKVCKTCSRILRAIDPPPGH